MSNPTGLAIVTGLGIVAAAVLLAGALLLSALDRQSEALADVRNELFQTNRILCAIPAPPGADFDRRSAGAMVCRNIP